MKTLKILIAAWLMIGSISGFGFDLKIDPNINPRINPNVSIRLTKPPIFQLGDWNSAGAPQPPYTPSFPFVYACQVQLSDQIRREEPSGQSFQFFAIADFQLNNSNSNVRTEDLQWFGKKFYHTRRILNATDAIPFATGGSQIGIHFQKDYQGDDETVYLRTNLRQKINQLIFSDSSTATARRSTPYFSTSVYLNLEQEAGQEIPRMMMRVLCTKEK
jgi:hypothetical protein